MHRLGLRLL